MSKVDKNIPTSESELQYELAKMEKVYNNAKLDKFPDGGEKLRIRMDKLKKALENLNINISEKDEAVPEPSTDKIELSGKHLEKDSDNKIIKETSKPSIKKQESSAICEKHEGVEKIVKEPPSFKDLSDKFTGCGSSGPIFKELPKTPSFTTYRSREGENCVKYIEAQPLPNHLQVKQKLNFQSACHSRYPAVNCVSKTAKEEAVFNIHSSLTTCPSAFEEERDPEHLRTSLMRHQKQGLSWLLWRETQKPSGGILADDMGLGKTLTMISLILKAAEQNVSTKATLVVCLASVIHQWDSEIIKHCKKGTIKVLVYHGTNREQDIKIVESHDIVLTTYNLVLSEGKNSLKSSPLFKIDWQRIILDEAHTIKNSNSQTAQYVFKLSSTSKWAVTGTPIHNDLKDVYCLLKFLQCKPFDDYNVWKKLIKDFSDCSVKRRNTLINSILLRRNKEQKDEFGSDLVKLPEKTTMIHLTRLSEKEMMLYEKIESQFKAKLDKYLELKNSTDKNKSGKLFGNTLLTLLLKLQQCCNHPNLIKEKVGEDSTDSFSNVLEDFSSLNISCKKTLESASQLNLSFGTSDLEYPISEPSAKIKKLLKKITVIQEEKEKIVIVSQWVSMLKIVAFHLKKSDIHYCEIKGSTKVEDRNYIAQEFNMNPDGPPVLLLSLKAGGTGLNLVGGNHLFLLDLHWNPALEMQASDRIHRVGQQRPVFIHKFVCKCTIEEKILNMQEAKKSLAKSVLEAAKQNYTGLTMDDLKDLFYN